MFGLVDALHFFTEGAVRCDPHQILPTLLTMCWVVCCHLRQGVKLSDWSTGERHLGLFPVGSVVMAGLFKSLDVESRRKNVPVLIPPPTNHSKCRFVCLADFLLGKEVSYR